MYASGKKIVPKKPAEKKPANFCFAMNSVSTPNMINIRLRAARDTAGPSRIPSVMAASPTVKPKSGVQKRLPPVKARNVAATKKPDAIPAAAKPNPRKCQSTTSAPPRVQRKTCTPKKSVSDQKEESPRNAAIQKRIIYLRGKVSRHDFSVQTNEADIVDVNMMSGDMRVLGPSPSLLAEIEQKRHEERKKNLEIENRRIRKHAKEQEQHLNELKEFLDKASVTQRVQKAVAAQDGFAADRSLMSAMDRLINREVPKSESITKIKERIMKKEEELFSLFNNVDKLKFDSEPNSEA